MAAVQQMLVSYGGSGPPPSSLSSLILASTPAYYYRLAEASGLSMVDSGPNTLNGNYNGSYPGGNAALYSGGPTSALFTGSVYGYENSSTLVAMNSLTVMGIFSLNNTTGLKSLFSRDENSTGRKFQFRANGTSLDFVKIVGGVVTATATSVFAASTPCMVAVTVSATGSIKLYKNGVLQSTTASAAANYGGAGDRMGIGYSTGISASLTGYASECAIWGAELSAATLLSFATAAGF